MNNEQLKTILRLVNEQLIRLNVGDYSENLEAQIYDSIDQLKDIPYLERSEKL